MKQKLQAIILDFGDYSIIEHFRYGCDNEHYIHQVVGRLRRNTWVDVPVKHTAEEVIHDTIEDVVACICCGVFDMEIAKDSIRLLKALIDKDYKDRNGHK